MKYSIGIDLGGTDIKAGLLAADGKLSCRIIVPTRVDEGAKAIAARIAQTIYQVIEAAEKGQKKEIVGIGLGAPGTHHCRQRYYSLLTELPGLERHSATGLCHC